MLIDLKRKNEVLVLVSDLEGWAVLRLDSGRLLMDAGNWEQMAVYIDFEAQK